MNALMLAVLLGLTPSNQETPTATVAPTPNEPTPNVVTPAPLEADESARVDEPDPFFDGIATEEIVVETVIESAESHEPTTFEKLAHLHPMVVHMPIAWLLLLVLLEWALVWRPGFVTDTARVSLWALTMLSFLPALGTGLLFSEFVYEGSSEEVLAPILDHRNEILLSAGLLALGWLVRRRRPEGPATALVLSLAMIAMTIGAHSGGLLVYGEDYFPF